MVRTKALKRKVSFTMNGKLLVPILFLLTVTLSCAPKDDAVYSYWDNGNVRSELRYSDGKLDGVCRWYYSSGVKSMESVYAMNVLNGETTRWHENGQLMEKSYYKDNQYDGVVEEYNVAGVLVKKSNYVAGVLNGMIYQWYDDGKPFLEGEYLGGMMHGSWIMYYQDGSIGCIADYDRGTGEQRGFSQGGLYQNALVHYKDNLKDGREIRYAMDGSVEEILIWDKGEFVGNVLIDK